MVIDKNEIKQLVGVFTSLSDAISKLKAASREKYLRDKPETQDDYQSGYMVGFNFGQLNALEDCANLIDITRKDAINVESMIISGLTKQVFMLEKLLQEVLSKTSNNKLSDEERSTVEEALKMIRQPK